jgi:hypothetical protein
MTAAHPEYTPEIRDHLPAGRDRVCDGVSRRLPRW